VSSLGFGGQLGVGHFLLSERVAGVQSYIAGEVLQAQLFDYIDYTNTRKMSE
jgi:hypothetical protein